MSLRMLIQDRQEEASEMPATYWEAVAKLQRAEVNALRRSDPDAVGDARAEWIREEAAAAPDLAPLPSESLEQLKAALHPGTVLLSFRLGAPASWVWALDRSGLALYQLPSRAEIQSLAEDASRAIREGDSRSESPARLYRVLFAGLAPRFLNQSRWLLALDPGLMNIPFGALEVTGGTHPSYVAEHHVVETIPGAGYWIEAASRRSRPDPAGLFVGIGDPIYNMADSRLPQASPRGRPHARWSLFAASHENFALPRLLGSGAEVEQCARTWKGRSVLLRGTDASGDRVRETLRRGPEVVHFAVHFVESSAPRFQALMALGMGGGEPELIGPVEVSHWRTRASLVVLSGCNSAAGEQLPGTGLMGLTRAWLTAGARSVLGSRWATPDEEGALFAAFYSDYGANGVDAAAALARAQIRMIREGGWRSKPSYWGAWFVVGN